jgi:hypothetical protein
MRGRGRSRTHQDVGGGHTAGVARLAAGIARIAALIVADANGGTRSGRAWEGGAASSPGAHAIGDGRKLDAMFAGDVAT